MALAAKDSCPIILTGNTGALSNTGLSQVAVPPDTLINRTGVPIWVDAIRFTFSQTGAVGSLQAYSLKVRAFLGRHMLTRNFVQLALLCRVNDFTKEGFPAGSYANGVLTWKMSKPLYLPPGQAINIDVQNDVNDRGTIPAGVVSNVEVSIIGRSGSSLDPIPDLVAVPYVAAWMEPWRTAAQLNGANDLLSNSTAVDLINPFDQPLFVKEFLGAVGVNSLNGALYQILDSNRFVGGLPYDEAQVTMVSARPAGRSDEPDLGANKLVVRDAMPFSLLFNALTRAWTVNAQLQPHGWYQVRLRTKGAQSLPAGISGRRHGVSMVGYRMLTGGAMVL